MPQIQLPLMIVVFWQIWALVTASRIIIKAFKKSPGWGVASLFIPFAYFVFIIKYWKENWKLAIIHIIFIILCIWGTIAFWNSGFIQQYLGIKDLDLDNFLQNLENYLRLLNGDTNI